MVDVETKGDLEEFVKQIVEGAPLEIRSDGSPVNTHVTVNGKPLSCIQEMNIRFGADRLMTRVDLTIMAPKLRLKGKVAKVIVELEDVGDAVDPGDVGS